MKIETNIILQLLNRLPKYQGEEDFYLGFGRFSLTFFPNYINFSIRPKFHIEIREVIH